MQIRQIRKVQADIDIRSGDKSIAHRSAMLALFSDRPCRIRHFLYAKDTVHSLNISQSLGLRVESKNQEIITHAPDFIHTPDRVLECGNSGTSMRIFIGILSGANVYSVLQGDESLNKRPMKRVIDPIRRAGANIIARERNSIQTSGSESVDEYLAPVTIMPVKNRLHRFKYISQVPSAQVKSAMILAGLFADGESSIQETSKSRDHSENMLLAFQKEKLLRVKDKIYISPFDNLHFLNGFDIEIPNDPSSAFFFAVMAAILPGSIIRLKNILLNETRIEAYKILERMGAHVTYENVRSDYEKRGDIVVRSATLACVDVRDNIPWLIDEIPALSIAMSMAKGRSSIRGASELRAKESDRICTIVSGLRNFGIECEEFSDGFSVLGSELKCGKAEAHGDHRIAMSFVIASTVSGGTVEGCECIDTSFPNFFEIIDTIRSRDQS